MQINLRGDVKIGDFGMSVQLNSTLGRAFTWVGKVNRMHLTCMCMCV